MSFAMDGAGRMRPNGKGPYTTYGLRHKAGVRHDRVEDDLRSDHQCHGRSHSDGTVEPSPDRGAGCKRAHAESRNKRRNSGPYPRRTRQSVWMIGTIAWLTKAKSTHAW